MGITSSRRKVRGDEIFDDLGDTKATPDVNLKTDVVDVTLDFKGAPHQPKAPSANPAAFRVCRDQHFSPVNHSRNSLYRFAEAMITSVCRAGLTGPFISASSVEISAFLVC